MLNNKPWNVFAQSIEEAVAMNKIQDRLNSSAINASWYKNTHLILEINVNNFRVG